VLLGAHNLEITEGNKTAHKVKRIIIHKGFDREKKVIFKFVLEFITTFFEFV